MNNIVSCPTKDNITGIQTTDNTISWTVTKDNITDIQKHQFAIDKLKELKDSIEKESIPEHLLNSDPETMYKGAVNKILYNIERMIIQLDQEKIDLGLNEEVQ